MGSTGDSGSRRISDFLKFGDLADVLEKICTAETNDKKKRYLEKYIKWIRDHFNKHYKSLDSSKARGDSLYCVVRVFLLDIDRGRRAYGFKSTSLARMFVEILGIDKNSRDGKSLTEFKDPRRAGHAVGDIASVIYNLLKSRFGTNANSAGVKLTELHDTLDKLSRGSVSDVNQVQQKKILQSFVRKLSPLEGKWLVRILLKNLHLGFSSTKNSILALLHPQGKVISEKIGDLEVLCQKLNDPTANVEDVDVLLFNHFRPMLATRMDIIDSSFEKSSLGSSQEGLAAAGNPSKWGKPTRVSLPPPPFYVETKWDGERFQIHYDGQEFKYFSRRAFDFSRKFNETLTPQLRLQVKPGVQSFILDGEMMAYHRRHKIFTQKGFNIDVKTMNKDNPNHCPVFVAFDIVYFNGSVLTKVPLKERRLKLNEVFEAKEDVIRFSEVKVMNSKEEVIECLNTAIDNLDEGLIAKDANSTYEAGKRLETWLKIKPEYLEDNTVDDLDLVILGAYYTESVRRGGEINHFLVGMIDTSKGKLEYYPLARVGSGRLRSPELKELVKDLEPKFVRTAVENVCWKARKRPDFMIHPDKSVVVQVKASEIIPSDVYACNYTLRFPRITKVRRDKSHKEIMEVQEFLRIREACGGKLAKRTDSRAPSSRKKRHHSDEDTDEDVSPAKKATPVDEDDDFGPLPGPSRPLLSVSKPKILLHSPSKPKTLLSKSPAKISPHKLKTNLIPTKGPSGIVKNVFNSKLFCVYGSTSWKAEMESKIQKFDGNITQSPDVKLLFAIVGDRRSVLVRKAINSKKYDVINPIWIEKCIEKQQYLPLQPLDYLSMTDKTQKQFSDEYDEYGDSYTKDNTIQETEELIKRILQNENDKNQVSPRGTPSPQKGAAKLKGRHDSSSESDDGNGSDSSISTDFSEGELMTEIFSEFNTGKCKDKENRATWNFLADVKLAFRGQIDTITRSKFEFYGGKVVAEDDDDITHVVLCAAREGPVSDHSRAFVVKLSWLEECLRKKKPVDEREYVIA